MQQLFQQTTTYLLAVKKDTPLRVGIDGIDAAGKTQFAAGLAAQLQTEGCPVIQSSVDHFHNPREVRYRQGKFSPVGYYEDSFNYAAFRKCLLEPLGPDGSRQYRTAHFDLCTDCEVTAPLLIATNDHILICDGIFLFREELLTYWDVKIFLEISFETSLQRALARDLTLLGSKERVIESYQRRYIPGQQHYLKIAQPKQKADMIIDNNDYQNPVITFVREQ